MSKVTQRQDSNPLNLARYKQIFSENNLETFEQQKQRDWMALELLKTYRLELLDLMENKAKKCETTEDFKSFNNDLNTGESEFNGIMMQLITAIENNRKRFK